MTSATRPDLLALTLIASLGEGGMARVYLALMAGPGDFNKLLVVKMLHGSAATATRGCRSGVFCGGALASAGGSPTTSLTVSSAALTRRVSRESSPSPRTTAIFCCRFVRYC